MTDPHAGWFRVEEEAMRLIDRSWDKLCNARSAANCYVTLCRIANLKGNDVFEVSIASLARDMHCVYRDAQKALALVESIGLVKIERRKIPGTKENAPSIYTVVRARPDTKSAPTDNMSEGHGRDHVHDPSRSFPKNGSKNSSKNFSKSTSSDDDVFAFEESLKAKDISEEKKEFIRKFNDYARSHSHALLPITAYTSELVKALDVHEDNLGDLFDTVAEAVENFTGESDKRLTLVRLAWGSY